MNEKSGKPRAKVESKTYCLWGSCRRFANCVHMSYISVGKSVAKMSLTEAKNAYPDVNFCQDWEEEASQ